MSVSMDFDEYTVNCDIVDCGTHQSPRNVRNHVHLRWDTTDTPKDDPRMSSLLGGWKLDVFGVGIDICPECLEVKRP